MAVTISYQSDSGSTRNSSTSSDPSRTGNPLYQDMDDGGLSLTRWGDEAKTDEASNIDDKYYDSVLHAHHIFRKEEIDLYNKTYRFGLFNPYNSLSKTKEFLFFTKPDLNIISRDDNTGVLLTTNGKYMLNEGLQSYAYWKDLVTSRYRTVEALQSSLSRSGDNFNHLLQNQCITNLEIPSLSAETIDTPSNMYGVNYSYRGSSEASDDNFDFSLEFKDDKYLDVYYFFKTYEEYETLKHHGTIAPWQGYIEQKIIHDQFSIYKFLVDEDMETIIYYCKFFGVMPKSLPRDTFSSASFDTGLSYSIDFRAAFFEDMKPEILMDFNNLSHDFYYSQKYQVDIYQSVYDRVDNRAATAAYVQKVTDMNDPRVARSPNGYIYKLLWRGSDQI